VQRFYVAEPLSDGEVRLPEHVARQVTTVLRLKPGDRVVLFDGSGPEWVAELLITGKKAAARLIERREVVSVTQRQVTLCQAVLKGERMEWVLQKGTELGVSAFQPVLTERVVARTDKVPRRWRRIVEEAVEQCGRTRVPSVRTPITLAEALAQNEAHVFCWEGERGASLWNHLARGAPQQLTLYVGPEGGFAQREAELARDWGAAMVSLGPLILRAETAAVAASALTLLAP
jgi:16S rRNA (uracil1498-N3)-methyltransferase